jgi:hypothetical protein
MFFDPVGMTGRLTSRKLHFLVRRVAVGEFALPERMQQNCASGIMNSPKLLNERVLFRSDEFHSSLKRATTSGQGASVALAAARFARQPS